MGRRVLTAVSCVMIVLYMAWMLCVPALPVTDASGQLVAVPRWEYWLLQASAPSSLVWHWTGGFNPVMISDRVPVVLLALLWFSMASLTGGAILRLDTLTQILSKWQRRCLAIVVGHSFLAGLFLILGSCLGTRSPLAFLMGVVGFNLLLRGLANISKRSLFLNENYAPDTISKMPSVAHEFDTSNEKPADHSLSHSVFRRLIGLLILGSLWLALIQAYGSSIPTVDEEVRTSDWWLVQHSLQEGRIRFYPENMDANAPCGPSMPSLFGASVCLTILPAETEGPSSELALRKHMHQCNLIGVLAGKMIGSLLCLTSLVFLGLYVHRQHGLLPACAIVFLLLATPGIAELIRFGRPEALLGSYSIVLVILWANSRSCNQGVLAGSRQIATSPAWWFVVAGTLLLGYGSAVLIGIPGLLLVLHEQLRRRWTQESPNSPSPHRHWYGNAATATLLLGALTIGLFPYARNLVAWGDPVAPWTGVAMHAMGLAPENQEAAQWSKRFAVPSETVWEQVSKAEGSLFDARKPENDAPRSAYRLANGIDGWNRLIWDSNVHGLLLIPFAILGLVVSRFGLATRSTEDTSKWGIVLAWVWSGAWIFVWWLLSRRLDRDWVGVLFLFSFPAALGIRWMMDRAWPYCLGGMLTIAMVWSVLVIPSWPTSDNRILMSIQSLDSTLVHTPLVGRSPAEAPKPEDVDTKSVIGTLNALIEQELHMDSLSKLLLVGSNDDFGLLCDSAPFSSVFELPGTDPRQRSQPQWMDSLRSEKVTHIALLWPEIVQWDQKYGQKTESSYREFLAEGMSLGWLDPVVLELNSSRVQLFRVNQE